MLGAIHVPPFLHVGRHTAEINNQPSIDAWRVFLSWHDHAYLVIHLSCCYFAHINKINACLLSVQGVGDVTIAQLISIKRAKEG